MKRVTARISADMVGSLFFGGFWILEGWVYVEYNICLQYGSLIDAVLTLGIYWLLYPLEFVYTAD